jgi:hypothetical protein
MLVWDNSRALINETKYNNKSSGSDSESSSSNDDEDEMKLLPSNGKNMISVDQSDESN